jgi:uncharacterized membrane protein YgdD (TMEM256/DUF423 family)
VETQTTALPYFFAGVLGVWGVVMLAMGSHPPAIGILATGGQFLLFHAPAVIAVASQTRFGGVYQRAAIALLLAGPAIFAAGIVVHAASGMMVPGLTPIGGGVTILGWLCVAIGALRSSS